MCVCVCVVNVCHYACVCVCLCVCVCGECVCHCACLCVSKLGFQPGLVCVLNLALLSHCGKVGPMCWALTTPLCTEIVEWGEGWGIV